MVLLSLPPRELLKYFSTWVLICSPMSCMYWYIIAFLTDQYYAWASINVDQTKQGQRGRTIRTADTWQQQQSKQASKEGIKSGIHRGTVRKRREEAEINTVKLKTKTKSEAVDSYLFIFFEDRFF
jgi:hypothetical protein